MPIDGIDVQIQSLISSANLDTQKEIGKEDEADHARKVAEKKIAEKKENLKSTNLNREVFQKQNDVNNKMRQIMGGAAGQDAANGLNEWQNNGQLQSKLTEAQKNLFREAMANNPKKGTQTARAMNNISKQPGFEKAVKTSQQAGTIQEGLIKDPKSEKQIAQLLQNRFMQAPKSDAQAKNSFLRFGMQQTQKGNLESVKKAGDMLGTMSKANVGKTAQRAGINMAQRTGNPQASENVDKFLQNPDVGKMPAFARTKSTELLAKADGKKEVKEGFEELAGDKKFQAQTAQNKGRFFSTIGTGRPSEFRAITDTALVALQDPSFPKRSGQVGKFLNKMSVEVAKGGANGIDTKKLIKSSKKSDLPTPPRLESTSDLDDEEAARARSRNRSQVMQFFTKLQRTYEDGEKKLNSAKYLEDVNALQNLREAGEIDVSMLSPTEQAYVMERQQALGDKLTQVRSLQRQRSRELRTKRMPPAKRRAREAARRAKGRQPKYFNPNVGKQSGTQAFTKKVVNAGQPQTFSQPIRRTGGGSIDQQVANAVSQLGDGPITPQIAGQVAATIAQQVAQQVAAQVTEQLLAGGNPVATPTQPQPMAKEMSTSDTQQGKVDGWGIPRTFERDLGGVRSTAVRPKADIDAEPTYDDLANEVYRGRTIVKDQTSIRGTDELFAEKWKGLSKAEMALLKNLGWTQLEWDTKDSPAAKWPIAMGKPFANLNPTQRESVRKLGFSPHDWDSRVQAFTTGKNA